jgi:hypothetical protein
MLMLKKNIILAFLLFNLLNYNSQLFASYPAPFAGGGSAGPGDEMADSESDYEYEEGEVCREVHVDTGYKELHKLCNNTSTLVNSETHPVKHVQMLIATNSHIVNDACNIHARTPLACFCAHINDDEDNEEEENKLTNKSIRMITRALISLQNINQQDNNGNTPLHLACLSFSPVIIETLLKNGATASLNIQNKKQQTPLHLICCHELKADFSIQLVRDMITKENLPLQDFDGNTALHCACLFSNSTAVEALMNNTGLGGSAFPSTRVKNYHDLLPKDMIDDTNQPLGDLIKELLKCRLILPPRSLFS